jgi:hypothetical protein
MVMAVVYSTYWSDENTMVVTDQIVAANQGLNKVLCLLGWNRDAFLA